jgi:uncharacterized protein with beta-barrel porin domain
VAWGLAMGGDKQLTDDLLLGVAFSYINIAVTVDGNFGNTNINNFQFSLYGSYDFTDALFLSGEVSYALGHNANYRYNAGGSGLTAEGSYFSNQFLAQTQLGYQIDLNNNMTLTPVLINDIAYYRANAYDETGAGGVNLKVGSSDVTSYNIGGGINYEWDIHLSDSSVLSPSVFLGYTVDLINDAVSSTAQFAGGGAIFETTGITPARSAFLLNTGLVYQAYDNVEIRLDYSVTAKDQYLSQAGALKGSYLF